MKWNGLISGHRWFISFTRKLPLYSALTDSAGGLETLTFITGAFVKLWLLSECIYGARPVRSSILRIRTETIRDVNPHTQTKTLNLSETDAELLQPRRLIEAFLLWESKSWLMFAKTEPGTGPPRPGWDANQEEHGGGCGGLMRVNICAGFRRPDDSFVRWSKLNCARDSEVVLLSL